MPLPDLVVRALRRLKAVHASDALAAGPHVYPPEGQRLVYCDQVGQPKKTDQLRRRWYRLCDLVGIRRVRLYDARPSCLTCPATDAGVPDVILAAWAGHRDAATTKQFYVDVVPAQLKGAADALGKILA